MTKKQSIKLDSRAEATPSEESEFILDMRLIFADLGETFITSDGCLYKAAHAYVAHWRGVREPTTLIPSGMASSTERLHRELMSFALDVATYGVMPMYMYHPDRSAQKPYDIVRDNPERTSRIRWGDFVIG